MCNSIAICTVCESCSSSKGKGGITYTCNVLDKNVSKENISLSSPEDCPKRGDNK